MDVGVIVGGGVVDWWDHFIGDECASPTARGTAGSEERIDEMLLLNSGGSA